jgi:16S rRNA (cytidine1402-2'-O)-methyltransferase
MPTQNAWRSMSQLGERASRQWYNNLPSIAMSGTLFVVATPIGNLEDVTLRALRVLQTADLIAAEDTRRTARLLTHHGIATPTLSFHQHNTRARIPQLIRRLQTGESIAVVTDAGTPGVSDPGIELVQAAIEAGIPVDPVPGVSAPLTAAIASGFPLMPLTIFGFAPARAKDRSAWLQSISDTKNTLTFFETPHRIGRTMEEAGLVLGNRPIVVGRELTKAHQEFIRGTAQGLSKSFGNARGEYTVVVGPATDAAVVGGTSDDEAIVADFCYSTEIVGNSRRTAIKSIAKKHRLPSRVVYQIVERSKNLADNQ